MKAAEQEEEAPAITADDMVEQLAVEEKTGKEKDLRGLVMGFVEYRKEEFLKGDEKIL